MKEIVIIFFIAQLLSNAGGIIIIDVIRPLINKKINSSNKLKEKYEYATAESISIIKALIPFYYAKKAIKLVEKNNVLNYELKEERTTENDLDIYHDEIKQEDRFYIDENLAKYVADPTIEFVKPDTYRARKNTDILENSNVETLKSQIMEVPTENCVINITPYQLTEYENANVEEEIKDNKNDKIITNEEISHAIGKLNYEQLEMLNKKIHELAELKQKKLTLKDVA